MKKLFTLVLLTVLCSVHVSAQLNKGQAMLGGSVTVNNDKTAYSPSSGQDNEIIYTTIDVYPQIGFGIGNNWIIGLRPGYSFFREMSKNNFGEKSESKTNGFSIGAFARKFHSFGERFGIFGQADLAYGFSKRRSMPNSNIEYRWESNSFDVSLRPGAYFKTGKRFILEATIGSIGYRHTRTEPQTLNAGAPSKATGFRLALASSFSLGFQVIL